MSIVPTLLPLPVDERAADLAVLVAHPTRPRPFLLDAKNRRAGDCRTVAEAAGTGRPYVVTVAPDVLAWDADTDAQAAAAERLASELVALGVPALLHGSGRPGHRHLWAVVPDRTTRARYTEQAAALGLAAPRSVMRPPGSPHRLELDVEPVDDPAGFVDAVEAARAAALDLDRPLARLDWRALLTTGRFPRGWTGEGSPSSMVWHAAIGAIRAGVTLDAFRAQLADPANLGGTAYRDRLDRRGKSHADHWLPHYVWPSAAERAARTVTPPADAEAARAHLSALRDAIDAHRWRGMSGATDRAVLVALVARAEARGSLTPSMSHRELAEAAPCSRSTVHRAIPRLVAAGWLTIARVGRGGTVADADGTRREAAYGTRWRLHRPSSLPSDPSARVATTGGTPPARTSLIGVSSRARLDVGRWRGLGLNAPRVLDVLADGPMSARALADVLGLNLGNLRARLLPRLAAHGLLQAAGGRWWVAEDLDAALAHAAEALDLTGKADAVALAHEADRAAYAEHREYTRPLRDDSRRRRVAVARRARWSDPLPFDGEAPRTSVEPVHGLAPPTPPPPPQTPSRAALVLAGGDDG